MKGRAIRLVGAVVAGLVVGSVVNMGLVLAGPALVPPPEGVDMTTVEGLAASIHLLAPKHFVFPFLAHALGTLVGAWVATRLTPGRTAGPAWVVGCLFLLGGAINVAMLPAPLWFEALDLIVAYLPMAWLGHRLAAGRAQPTPTATLATPA